MAKQLGKAENTIEIVSEKRAKRLCNLKHILPVAMGTTQVAT